MNYLIGTDIGTSGTKSIVMDTNGALLASSLAEYGVTTPRGALGRAVAGGVGGGGEVHHPRRGEKGGDSAGIGRRHLRQRTLRGLGRAARRRDAAGAALHDLDGPPRGRRQPHGGRPRRLRPALPHHPQRPRPLLRLHEDPLDQGARAGELGQNPVLFAAERLRHLPDDGGGRDRLFLGGQPGRHLRHGAPLLERRADGGAGHPARDDAGPRRRLLRRGGRAHAGMRGGAGPAGGHARLRGRRGLHGGHARPRRDEARAACGGHRDLDDLGLCARRRRNRAGAHHHALREGRGRPALHLRRRGHRRGADPLVPRRLRGAGVPGGASGREKRLRAPR